ncbi:MAG: hypothetical protein LBD59_01915 [Prevotellaceae bacterium]|jgi:hypothetical protein|nr:hypothetical protein [Prevotellaceae bacterium]
MTEFEKDMLFEYISDLVLQGYIAGYDPNWQLSFIDISHSEISEGTVKHIAQQIKDWVKSGEIQEDYKQGWWYLGM